MHGDTYILDVRWRRKLDRRSGLDRSPPCWPAQHLYNLAAFYPWNDGNIFYYKVLQSRVDRKK